MAELLPWPRSQFFDDNGNPLAGGKLFSYKAGSSIPLTTYADKAGTTPNANPVVLNSRGEALIFLSAQAYKLVLKDANDATIWTHDNFIVTQTDAATLAAAIAAAQAAQTSAESAQSASETAKTAAEAAQTAAASSASASAGSASSASTSASTATTQAGLATTAKTAAEAAQAAAEAAQSSASTSASTATTQAGIATTKAGEAASSASAAATSATNAAGAVSAHTGATTGAHAATAISASTTGVSGTDVQANLTDLKTQIDTKAATSSLTSHTSATTSAHGIPDTSKLLSMTTAPAAKGDLIVRDSTALTVLNVGTNGLYLRANSSTATGLEWASAAANLSVVSKTTTYTATTSDDVIAASASGGSWVLTLPTAVGNTGKVFRIVKTDTTTGTVTIATTSSQTIGGRASSDIVLLRPRDFIAVVSDGANWEIIAKKETKVLASTSTYSAAQSSNKYVSLTGNSITLTYGQWRVYAVFGIDCNSSSATSYLNTGCGVYEANGTNTTTPPTALSGTVYGDSTIGSTFLTGQGANIIAYFNTHTVSFDYHVTASTTIYAVPQIATNSSTSTVKAKIWAERIW